MVLSTSYLVHCTTLFQHSAIVIQHKKGILPMAVMQEL